MTAQHFDVQSATGIAADGTEAEFVRVPEGHVLVLVSEETAREFAEWTECQAVRLLRPDEEPVAFFQTTDDLDALTAPEDS